MPDRIPLLAGPSCPKFVDEMLSVFGKNPHGEPNFRLIWSERKQIWFDEGAVPEYAYLPYSGWVLETWIAPEKDAGPRSQWGPMQEAMLGPYPTHGTYNFVKQYPEDWQPTEESVRLVCVGIMESRAFTIKQRADAIRERLIAEENEGIAKNAAMIEDSFDSASLGKITAGVSGPKNNFRTLDDYERDLARAMSHPTLPTTGGAVYTPGE